MRSVNGFGYLCLLLFLSRFLGADFKKDYSGYALIRISPRKADQLNFLKNLWLNNADPEISFWKPPTHLGASVDILVHPDKKDFLVQQLSSYRLSYWTQVENLEKAIKQETNGTRPSAQYDSIKKTFKLDQYHRLGDIEKYLDSLSQDHSKLVRLETIGRTHEGRSLKIVKISSGGAGKPGIWIDGGIHAREWVSPASVLHFINTLATKYNQDDDITRLVDGADWFLMPVVNPDGFEYTHTNDRLWRKNRSPTVCRGTSGFFWRPVCCKGVDLNRNFDYHFMETGSSNDPCSEVYAGTNAFSEPEARAVRDVVTDPKRQIKAFITIHSYSQIWMYPYGWRKNTYPSNKNELHSVATDAARALKTQEGTRYTVGTGANLLYEASGGSDDWAKGAADIDLVYLLELRPSPYDGSGFILPENQILPTARETWAGIRVVADAVIAKNPTDNKATTKRPETIVTDGNLTERPPPSCQDKSTYCNIWKIFGGCNIYQISSNLCRRTCGTCR